MRDPVAAPAAHGTPRHGSDSRTRRPRRPRGDWLLLVQEKERDRHGDQLELPVQLEESGDE